MSVAVSFDVVVPTVGRPALRTLLASLSSGMGPLPDGVFVVDDRATAKGSVLQGWWPGILAGRVEVVHTWGRGPAAARNAGWRRGGAEWVAFLDDDVEPSPTWRADLAEDLRGRSDAVGGVQGRLRVPLPMNRRPTDWERNTHGLERARWATADMAYRRTALESVDGFDERFPRAYREDADLALRVLEAGFRLERGRRRVEHPVRPADRWVSVRLQRGNGDDPLMRAMHGRAWRARAQVPTGRFPWHLATSTAGAAAVVGVATRRSFGPSALAVWAGLTGQYAWERIAPGPRSAEEVWTMLVTSPLIPPLAVWHRAVGMVRARRAGPWTEAADRRGRGSERMAA